jgi:CBS domain containing-hemolysin-like protein
MLELTALVAVAGLYASAYVVSLYSLAVYIDPDEMETAFPEASRRQRHFLRRMASDPRAFVQIATVYKIVALVAVVLLVRFLLVRLALVIGTEALYLYVPGFILVWLLQIFGVEYLSRKASRRTIRNRMPRYFWLISLIYIVLRPVVWLYRAALARHREDEQVTEEEKEDIVERAIETLADQAGIGEVIVEEDEKEMIGRIFLLDQTTVREIMVPRIDITGIERSMTFVDIQKLVLRDGHSRYPVFEETIDKIIGILYVKDLFNNMPQPGEEFVISNYLRRPFFVPEAKVIGELLREFQSKKLHLAVVADEYGGVAGLVTLEDILEEVFGEIQDEHDSEEAEIARLGEGVYSVDPGLLLERLQDYLDTDYAQGDYETVGGLIYDLVGSVPSEGHAVRWHGLRFEVTRAEGQRIMRVKVYRRHSAGNDR